MPRWSIFNALNSRFFSSGTRTLTSKIQLPVRIRYLPARLRYSPLRNIREDTGHTESPDPISLSEFRHAFHSIWKPVAMGGRNRIYEIGIAVSGGIDSMALAILCGSLLRWPEGKLEREICFHAFIVDHCARPSSHIEAQSVEQCLNSLGIPCTILALQWPEGVCPNHLPNFETLARRMRYQALGSACRDRHIQSLFVAHHRDDQVETVFLRLAQGHRGIGLKGIQPVAELPECWGIHGIHQSGENELEDWLKSKSGQDEMMQLSLKRSKVALRHMGRKFRLHPQLSQYEELSKKSDSSPCFEDGGINIYRPLLGFSKKRLEATCRRREIAWIEDETNSNPRLTLRNAIRHILKRSKMPHMLLNESILKLQERVQRKTLMRLTTASELLEKCIIMFLDTRSAGLTVRFFSRIRDNKSLFDEDQEPNEANMQYLAALLLRRMVEFVTPQETVSLQSLEFAVDAIFPDIKDPISTIADKTIKPSKFTAAGVSFVRIDSPLPNSPEITSQNLLDPKFAWVLTRQPIASNSKIPPIQINPQTCLQDHASPSTHISHPTYPPNIAAAAVPKFRLWDGRFWLRVHNPFPFPLIIRHLHPADLISLRASSQPKAHLNSLTELLREAAPGKIRFTLPVIAEFDQRSTAERATKSIMATKEENGGGEKENLRGTVLALPTLGWGDVEAKAKGLRWEARYKKVDLSIINMDKCVLL